MVTWGDNLLDQRLTQFLIFFIEKRKKKKMHMALVLFSPCMFPKAKTA